MIQTSIVALLDPPSYNYVRAVQLKMYELFGAKAPLKLEPHFTIKYAFEANNLGAVENFFDKLVKQTKEFDVMLNGIDSFKNEKNIVFLHVERNEGLQRLHMEILNGLAQKFLVKPSQFEGEELYFHITLAYKDISKQDFQKAMTFLKEEQPSFNFKVKRLALYLLPDAGTNWHIHKIGNLAE